MDLISQPCWCHQPEWNLMHWHPAIWSWWWLFQNISCSPWPDAEMNESSSLNILTSVHATMTPRLCACFAVDGTCWSKHQCRQQDVADKHGMKGGPEFGGLILVKDHNIMLIIWPASSSHQELQHPPSHQSCENWILAENGIFRAPMRSGGVWWDGSTDSQAMGA